VDASGEKAVPQCLIHRFGGHMRLGALVHGFQEFGTAPFMPAHADDTGAGWHLLAAMQGIQGGNQFARGEITAAAEKNEIEIAESHIEKERRNVRAVEQGILSWKTPACSSSVTRG
jgi:hypothetical protein